MTKQLRSSGIQFDFGLDENETNETTKETILTHSERGKKDRPSWKMETDELFKRVWLRAIVVLEVPPQLLTANKLIDAIHVSSLHDFPSSSESAYLFYIKLPFQ